MSMQKFLTVIILSGLAISCLSLHAQEPPFANEIRAFKKQDSAQAPPQHPILFAGSSSFRLWPNLPAWFPGHTVINRGFGGSTLPDLIRYADDIIFPYQPKQIVIYCGENDFAENDTVSSQAVFERFRKLFTLIRKKLPEVPLAYISMKPSPSRLRLHGKMKIANDLIREYLAGEAKTVFIDIWPAMLHEGKPDSTLYKGDYLHMNDKGYVIWQKAIEPKLVSQ